MKQCGDCSFCCKVFHIAELNKPKDTWCQHCVKPNGCNIYDNRPQPCQDFNCLWITSEAMPEELKPNRCHVMFTPTTDGKGVVAYVDKNYPRALESRWVKAFVAKCAQYVPVTIVMGDKRKIVGKHAQKLFDEVMRGINV